VDNDISKAIILHQQRFGEFNATILGLNLGESSVKQRLLDAISKALDTGVPISDSDIGVTYDNDVLI